MATSAEAEDMFEDIVLAEERWVLGRKVFQTLD